LSTHTIIERTKGHARENYMKDKARSAEVFRELFEAMRIKSDRNGEHYGFVACEIGKSRQTVRQYCCDPSSKQFRLPPLQVLDLMRNRVIHEYVHRPSTLRALDQPDAYLVGNRTFDDYVMALDLGDALKIEVRTQGDAVIPELSEDARLRHKWREVFFGGVVDRADLAILAEVDFHDVAWVGREHPELGRQPTREMVAKAVALEALTARRNAA
jgi:hypothetical protein